MGFLSTLFGREVTRPNDIPEFYSKDAEREKRLERYRKSWEAYLAELPDPIVPTGHDKGKSNDNVKVNPARALIDTSVHFLFGEELKFQVSPDAAETLGESDRTSQQITEKNPEWLKDLNRAWKANRKQSLLLNMGKSGAIHGDVIVKLQPNAAGISNEYPRVEILDPANVEAIWDPNDYTKVIQWLIQFVAEDDNGEPILRIQEHTANMADDGMTIVSWTIQDYEQRIGQLGLDMIPVDGDKVAVGPPVEWPYPWAQIEHCQNIEVPHVFWGMPDLDPSSVDVIESLQRVMSSLNKIVRVHASPRMFAKNVMPDQIEEIDISADNIITLPNLDSDLDVLNSLQNIAPSVQFAEKLKQDLYEMIQVPPIALGQFETASTSISGITLSIMYAPILQKTQLKRVSYGDMLERICQKMLILMGYEDNKDTEDLVLVWPEAMPGAEFIERQTLATDKELGVSKRTITKRLGYDPIEEMENRLEEMEKEIEIQAKLNKFNTPFGGPGGNNNPEGKGNEGGIGNRNGSLGGVHSAGVPKNPRNV